MALWVVRALMFLLGILLTLFTLYLFHGSVELFPTEEQQEKVRIGYVAVVFLLLGVEYLLFLLQKRINRKT